MIGPLACSLAVPQTIWRPWPTAVTYIVVSTILPLEHRPPKSTTPCRAVGMIRWTTGQWWRLTTGGAGGVGVGAGAESGAGVGVGAGGAGVATGGEGQT